MRAWVWPTMVIPCGSCGREPEVGTPMQTITKHGYHWKFYRCPSCAEGTPPSRELSNRKTTIELQTAWTQMGQLAVQFRRPEPKPVVVARKPTAYRGEGAQPVQAGLLEHLPQRTRR